MRPKGGNASLGELIGGNKPAMTLSNLPELLGEKTPELPRTIVGRYRLIRALRHRFGDSYRNIPGINNIIEEFDEDVRFEGVLEKARKIKPKKEE